ncbi:MAG: hypothetical protein WCO06_03645 [Candidatus Roizmanbacteria bacterium]
MLTKETNRKIKLSILFASILIGGYLFTPFGQSFIQQVQAGALSASKITISDSRASNAATTHTFNLTTGTTGTIASIDFQYCTSASGTCTAPTGLTLGTTIGTASGIGAGTASVASNTVTYTVTSPASITSSTAISIPFTNVTNPSVINTSYYVRVTTKTGASATIDTGTVAFAILDTTSISVTASVDPTLSFSLAAVGSTSLVNNASTTVTTTATTIPFGTLTANTPSRAAHDVTVTTNAGSGYTVTVKNLATPPLTFGSQNIDEFSGTNTAPTTWSSPAGVSASVNTGYFGYTTEDPSLCTGTASRFSSNKWAGGGTTQEELICSATGVNAQTTRVGWQVEVNGVQPAGSYSGTVILVATPTY